MKSPAKKVGRRPAGLQAGNDDDPIRGWTATRLQRVPALAKDRRWLKTLSAQLAGYKGVDGKLDGLWTCRRGPQVFIFNATTKPVQTTVAGSVAEIPPSTIWCNQPPEPRK